MRAHILLDIIPAHLYSFAKFNFWIVFFVLLKFDFCLHNTHGGISIKKWFVDLILATGTPFIGVPSFENIAKCKTSQAIDLFHLFEYFNFFGYHHIITFITRYFLSFITRTHFTTLFSVEKLHNFLHRNTNVQIFSHVHNNQNIYIKGRF